MKKKLLMLMMILGAGAVMGSDCSFEADTDDDDLDEIFKPIVTSQMELPAAPVIEPALG